MGNEFILLIEVMYTVTMQRAFAYISRMDGVSLNSLPGQFFYFAK